MRISEGSPRVHFPVNSIESPVRIGAVLLSQAGEIFQAPQGTRDRFQGGRLQVFQC